MEAPLFLTANFYDTVLNSGHTVTANEEATGNEVWRLANNRRSAGDYWTPTTVNQAATVTVDCASSKTADCIAIDRGHNLAGKTLILKRSTDNFAANSTTVFTATIPSASSADSDLDAANGVYTEEGAWVKRFTSVASRYWRVEVSAAASYKPQIVGLWLGEAWSLGMYDRFARPWDEDATMAAWEDVTTSEGWSAQSSDAAPRTGQVVLRLESFAAYDDGGARTFLTDYRTGRPAWFVPDPTAAERAALVRCPAGGRVEAPYETGWGYRTVRFPYVEHQPAL